MNEYRNDKYCQILIYGFMIALTLTFIISGGVMLGISKSNILAICLGMGFIAFGGICGIISVLEYLKIRKEKNKDETK